MHHAPARRTSPPPPLPPVPAPPHHLQMGYDEATPTRLRYHDSGHLRAAHPSVVRISFSQASSRLEEPSNEYERWGRLRTSRVRADPDVSLARLASILLDISAAQDRFIAQAASYDRRPPAQLPGPQMRATRDKDDASLRDSATLRAVWRSGGGVPRRVEPLRERGDIAWVSSMGGALRGARARQSAVALPDATRLAHVIRRRREPHATRRSHG
ncbi:hypothetical protein MKEN_00014400 [Mycena kentingensis (nom. inval.)]|nr:hypothetical protein MKEN_00014400 [Mycena kentingensis (nom. inval.)]